MWPQFDSRIPGSRPYSERFFSGYSCFPLSSKPTFPNSNLIWIIVKLCIMKLWLAVLFTSNKLVVPPQNRKEMWGWGAILFSVEG